MTWLSEMTTDEEPATDKAILRSFARRNRRLRQKRDYYRAQYLHLKNFIGDQVMASLIDDHKNAVAMAQRPLRCRLGLHKWRIVLRNDTIDGIVTRKRCTICPKESKTFEPKTVNVRRRR